MGTVEKRSQPTIDMAERNLLQAYRPYYRETTIARCNLHLIAPSMLGNALHDFEIPFPTKISIRKLPFPPKGIHTNHMTTDWLLRVGDGRNLIMSSGHKIWGIRGTTPNNKHFLRHVKVGDRLWFVRNKSQGKVIAVASYLSSNERGPDTLSNEDLNWTGSGVDWFADTEIHYTDLYRLDDCNMLTQIKSPLSIRTYAREKCRVDLPVEYSQIMQERSVVPKL